MNERTSERTNERRLGELLEEEEEGVRADERTGAATGRLARTSSYGWLVPDKHLGGSLLLTHPHLWIKMAAAAEAMATAAVSATATGAADGAPPSGENSVEAVGSI